MANTDNTPKRGRPNAQSQIDALKTQIAEMQSKQDNVNNEILTLLAAMQGSFQTPKTETPSVVKQDIVEETPKEEYSEPALNDIIRVVSLTRGILTLSYAGKHIQFSHFGEARRMTYADVMALLTENREFVKAGYFYVYSPAAIHFNNFENEYEKILNYEDINSICSKSAEELTRLFAKDKLGSYTHITSEQVETITKVIADKIYSGENVDMNKVAIISNLTGININDAAEEMKELAAKLA